NVATATGGPLAYIKHGVTGWLIDVFKGWNFGEVVRRFDRNDVEVIERFRVEGRRLLGDYLKEGTEWYYGYREKGESRWVAGMKEAFVLAHREVSIDVMVEKYGLLFESVLDRSGAQGYEEKIERRQRAREKAEFAGRDFSDTQQSVQNYDQVVTPAQKGKALRFGTGRILKVPVYVAAGRITVGDPVEGQFHDGWRETLQSDLNRLAAEGRAPPGGTYHVIVTVDDAVLNADASGLPYIAGTNVYDTVYYHPAYFEQSADKRFIINYHEFISHIAENVGDEAIATQHTRSFVHSYGLRPVSIANIRVPYLENTRKTTLTAEELAVLGGVLGLEVRTLLNSIAEVVQQNSAEHQPSQAQPLDPREGNVIKPLEIFSRSPELFLNSELTTEFVDARLPHGISIQWRGYDKRTGEAAQIALRGIYGAHRLAIFNRVKGHVQGLYEVNLSGRKTITINVRNVNRALALGYVGRHLSEILERTGYPQFIGKPGRGLNALQTRTIIASGAIGILFERAHDLSVGTLDDSPAREAFLKYLSAGGIYVLTTDESLEGLEARLFMRHGLSRQARSGLLISANGSATLAYFDPTGRLREYKPYNKYAVREYRSDDHLQDVDIVYIGEPQVDTDSDYKAFAKVGFDRSVNTSSRPTGSLSAELRTHHVGRQVHGLRLFLNAVDAYVASFVYRQMRTPGRSGRPLFSQDSLSRLVRMANRLAVRPEAEIAEEDREAVWEEEAAAEPVVVLPLDRDTLLAGDEVNALVQSGGRKIRAFLRFLGEHVGAYDNGGQLPETFAKIEDFMWDAAREYRENPDAENGPFSDRALVEKGDAANNPAATQYPIRIEVRGRDNERAAQVAVRGFVDPLRRSYLAEMKQELGHYADMTMKTGGNTTIEANVRRVDKGLALHYVARHFEELLHIIGYTRDETNPQRRINALLTRSLVAHDGDGTVYGKPHGLVNPTLIESPAHRSLMKYYEIGGVSVIISGNDLERTAKRLIYHQGIPQHLRHHIIVIANGGANLAYFDGDRLVEYKLYREDALREYDLDNMLPGMDAVYLGDDAKPTGNDWPAFDKIGFDRSVSVAKERTEEIDARLRPNHVGGLEYGTAAFLNAVVRWAAGSPLNTFQPLFTPANRARFRTEAAEELSLVQKMHRLRDKTVVDRIPVEVVQIIQRMESFGELRDWLERQLAPLVGHPSQRLYDSSLVFSRYQLQEFEILMSILGFESNTYGVSEVLATIVRNQQLRRFEERGPLNEMFRSSQRYQLNLGQNLEETVRNLVMMLTNAFTPDDKVKLAGRIKQNASLIQRLRKTVAELRGVAITDVSAAPRDLFLEVYTAREAVRRDPFRYFDDIVRVNVVVNDDRMSDAERREIMGRLMDQIQTLLRTLPGKVTAHRKESRVPGFEAGNIYVQGLLNHNDFGDLPVKIQVRFASALRQESAMYFMYRHFGQWQLSPWARDMPFDSFASFEDMQNELFRRVKTYFMLDVSPTQNFQETVPAEKHQAVQATYGPGLIVKAPVFVVNGLVVVGDPVEGLFSGAWRETLQSDLDRLVAKGRSPPDGTYYVIVTTDHAVLNATAAGLPFIAGTNLTDEVYYHPAYFDGSADKRLEITYHEFISHIA
ncbi:MAG: hypothetical protein U1D99_02095, partial [Candidatus Omnitrophota bacterium]|nr:hypothetical protein [Candidatus Omnitrophota bacterium]